MTKEEAKLLLIRPTVSSNVISETKAREIEAYNMAIEALSERTGEWKGYNADNPNWLRKDGTPIFLVCDKCHDMVLSNSSTNWNYCPHCGAKMCKGGDEE